MKCLNLADYFWTVRYHKKTSFLSSLTIQTPGDESSFEDEVCLLSGVEDFDEHPVHVVSLDSVPAERHENEVIAEHVGDTTAET